MKTKLCVLVVLLTIASCNQATPDPTAPDVPDISGAYLVLSGTQTVSDSTGYTEELTFSCNDEITLFVMQSQAAISTFQCLGELRGDTAQCNLVEDLSGFFGPACQTSTGTLTRNDDDTLTLDLHIDVAYPAEGYTATSDLTLTMEYRYGLCANVQAGG